jgi:16S rRNA (cytosine1402-N4)-methyltransferase
MASTHVATHQPYLLEAMNSPAHQPVMLGEALAALNVQPGGIYLDATFGRGGHAEEILARLGSGGRLYALDRDPDAVSFAEQRFGDDPRFVIAHASFAQLELLAREWQLAGACDGILMDLGVSSPQLDDPARGFSFKSDGPLDMRMNPRAGESAAAWIARADADEITRVLKEYGEERHARRIARAILNERDQRPIETTAHLAEVVAAVPGVGDRHKHAATRTFQAIRIHINHELDELHRALSQAVDVLAVGGRIVVISFHSLEDRIVKRFLRAESQSRMDPDMPLAEPAGTLRLKIVTRARHPGAVEIANNPRARSAVMRVAERLPAEDAS